MSLVLCHDCHMFHRLPAGAREGLASAQGFFDRHQGHRTGWAQHVAGVGPALPGLDWRGNADVKQAFGAVQALTITNANIATSATAGWKSAAQDNSATLALDALVQVNLNAVNTAPANSKAIFLFAYGLTDDAGTLYTSSGDGTPDGNEGTITFPDITANATPMPLLGVIPYSVQNRAISSRPFGVAKCFDGIMPPKWGVCMVNHSGMTLSVASIQVRPVYATVI